MDMLDAFACSECNETFATASALSEHVRSAHTSEHEGQTK